MILGLVATILSCAAFSFAYLYFLGLRIIRTGFDDRSSAFLTGLIVCSGILAATISLEAVLLISVTREVSGQLFYVASAVGVVVLAASTLGVIGSPKPIKVALAHRATAQLGLAIGNPLLISINALSFAKTLPSVL